MQDAVSAHSFLEQAFLRWVVTPAVQPEMRAYIVPQQRVNIGTHNYLVDYEFVGQERVIAVELDGYEFHGDRHAFTYDRMRQNDLAATGRVVVRFSYDAIRCDTERCVEQLQAVLALDPRLAMLLVPSPIVEPPDMDPNPIHSLMPARVRMEPMNPTYFETVRDRLNLRTLR